MLMDTFSTLGAQKIFYCGPLPKSYTKGNYLLYEFVFLGYNQRSKNPVMRKIRNTFYFFEVLDSKVKVDAQKEPTQLKCFVQPRNIRKDNGISSKC